jgi:hypothetical protein
VPASHRHHRVLAVALALGLLLVGTGSAAAMPPLGDPSSAAQGKSGGGGQDGGHGGGGQGGGTKTPHGYDISYPQCDGAYPANPAFGIVGVNAGKVFSANPCLASQITWGGGASAELYANTGNPGPALSSFWPNGQTTPRVCDAANPDTADCAYDYGWNAAKQSLDTAAAAYGSLGLTASPAATRWWLDVETMNSWRSTTWLNVAALQGEVDYLRSAGVTRLGFYSTTLQWGTITGGTTVFSPLPVWGAGSSSEKAALNLCRSTTTSFTGGPLSMVQYVASGFDVDIRC